MASAAWHRPTERQMSNILLEPTGINTRNLVQLASSNIGPLSATLCFFFAPQSHLT